MEKISRLYSDGKNGFKKGDSLNIFHGGALEDYPMHQEFQKWGERF
jgi:hypothetical protein